MSSTANPALLAQTKRAEKALPILVILSVVGGIVAVASVTCAISTAHWLETYEIIAGSVITTGREVICYKRTSSSLWQICVFEIAESDFQSNQFHYNAVNGDVNCTAIDLNEKYVPEHHDSTNAIPNAVIKAFPFFILTAVLIGIAFLCITSGYKLQQQIAVFAGGIVFIFSGFTILVGLVVYLSSIHSEVGSKLRPKNVEPVPLFDYKYGYSFIIMMFGFLDTELTGTCAIFYYIYWHQTAWERKRKDIREAMVDNHIRTNFPFSLYQHVKPSAPSYCQRHVFDDFGDIPVPPPPPPTVLSKDYSYLSSYSNDYNLPQVSTFPSRPNNTSV